MSEVLTLQLPDELARQARAFADATNRPLEDVVLDWISQAVADPAVETLADDSLLALCDLTLEPAQQEELNKLLERAQEGELETDDRDRLDQLMVLYRRGLKLKARAWKGEIRCQFVFSKSGVSSSFRARMMNYSENSRDMHARGHRE